ncbi:hypothetical protein COLO4_20099 [Corchorus olitorius]|uniref:Uncharacterized protein n=1 Tax=Corchorus olitorius TaxID=93759 RepID=A0A1R3J1M2_9ROSI|nr:hypothetical protein COLO4_20099 [Corchorus olitorius]
MGRCLGAVSGGLGLRWQWGVAAYGGRSWFEWHDWNFWVKFVAKLVG